MCDIIYYLPKPDYIFQDIPYHVMFHDRYSGENAPMCTILTGDIIFDDLFFTEKDRSRRGGLEHILEWLIHPK